MPTAKPKDSLTLRFRGLCAIEHVDDPIYRDLSRSKRRGSEASVTWNFFEIS
ncbi:hypothetical protein [Amaricoccus macauensis]|uniref:hypothetical protein n=1 Tax=Amaricoccus macauensis TaxID=57001 RepID=UPI003C7E87AC